MRPSPWRRIAALLLDYLLILAWILVLLCATLTIDFALFGGVPDVFSVAGIAGSELIGFLCLDLPVGLYLFLMERGARRATLGKRRMRLRVARRDGTDPSTARILVRTIVKLLPWELAHFFVFQAAYYSVHLRTDGIPGWILAGLIAANVVPVAWVCLVLFTPRRRGPHDYAAGTVVVDAR
jgi:uncharacterized RDD family membrane protein YckC